jgi:hypothetical protein
MNLDPFEHEVESTHLAPIAERQEVFSSKVGIILDSRDAIFVTWLTARHFIERSGGSEKDQISCRRGIALHLYGWSTTKLRSLFPSGVLAHLHA